MNKKFNSFLLLLSSTFLLASCNNGGNNGGSDNASSSVVAKDGLTLSQNALSLEAYESLTLTYTLVGKTGTPTWVSSDSSVATVDSSGKVTGVKEGSCTITATVGEYSDSCLVTVTAISQAPRIVLGEPSVSLDKGNSYTIDAYAIYKNEIRDDTLEISLKDGSDSTIASATYSNKKITINGLAYGSADFVVHAKVLGVLVTASLHVSVVNADLALRLGNIAQTDGDYSLDLAMYKVDEDGLPTEFTPEVIFTDKDKPATYNLAYTSSDSSVASWDDSHKILAKGVGDAVLKIACAEFGLSLEIKVSVVKGAYDVTLKNINDAGESATEKVGMSKMPKTAPSIEGKTFAGWYDEDGEKVTSITEDTTLIARWTVSHYTDENETLLKFTNNEGDYSTPKDVKATYAVRSDEDRQSDVNTWKTYPGTPDGSQGFYPGGNADTPLGLGLPAFDFSKTNGVRFVFGFSTGVWASDTLKGVYLNGTSIGTNQNGHAFKNFVVDIKGKTATVLNQDTAATYEITLSDDVYTGKKGLEITVDKNWGAWLFITPYVSFDCDYISRLSSIEKSLPDTPARGYSDQLEEYNLCRNYMTEYEKTTYPVSEKMQKWFEDTTETKVYEFTDSGASVLSGITGSGSKIAAQGSGYAVENSLQIAMNGMDGSYITMTLPSFDYSQYGSVSFKMGLGGGPGDRTAKYWLGSIPETATQYPIPESLMSETNFIGIAPSCDPTGSNWNTELTTVTISGGKAIFSSSSIDKTFDLSEDVNTGKSGLVLTVGWCSWNTFVITPFYASKV